MLEKKQMQDHVLYTLPRASVAAEETKAELPLWTAQAGDDGYFVVPYKNVCFLTHFTQREDVDYTTGSNLMPIVGVKQGDVAYLAVLEGMKYDARYRVKVENGQYSLSLTYDLNRISLYEDPSVRVYTLTGADANYSGMARLYRKMQVERLGLKPLSERAKTEPTIAYALDGMPIVRIRMGWKPVPSPVLEQTLETEPPMFTACTFADVERLVDEFKAQGIEKAELQLVGWNLRGHDGRWPQAFPVEADLGGEDAMRHLIQHVKEAGYRLVCHTNVNDAYRIADCWDENNLMRNKQGEVCINSEGWSGGRMYHMCLEPANRIQVPILDRLKEMGCDGFHYIDVLAIVDPRTCYHPDHPMNADEYVVKAREILAEAQKRMGGSSSEGGIDFAAGCLDFALYIAFNLFDRRPPVADEPIPLWQLVYHGYILSNASAETVNSMVKPPRHWLKAFEYGSIPAVYYYSRFVGGERRNWMGDDDMRFSTPEELHESVRLLKEYLDRYAPYNDRQLATMDSHERWADGVYCAAYSDGWRVVVNYNEQPYEGHGVTVPAQDAVQLPPV